MELSDDGEKLFVLKQSGEVPEMFIVPAGETFPEDVSKNTGRAGEWKFSIDPRLEWEQIFHDAWLMHREQFFDPEMRGLDWETLREKYAPLARRTTDRRELNDVFGQMMGELNALHSQVRGGDVPLDPDAPEPAALGAKLSQTRDGVGIEHIYRYDRERPAQAPPLAKPGVNAAVSDVISAINGIETPTLESVHRALRNQAGQQVLLQLQRGREELKTVVVPVGARDDASLRYTDWVSENRNTVEARDADLGYVHIRAMGNGDVASFARDFYANTNKKGMVIDVRRNNGGNVDSWIIDRLLRKAWSFWTARRGKPYTNMQNAFRGHLVVIADERTYSDGETFVAAIKKLDIAPVIGKRTSGAGVWLSGRNRVVDNGIARVAEFPVFGMDGEWLTEGYGINPTTEVDNLPHATFNGSDAQLEAAIEYLQQKIEQEPVPELNAKPFPEYPQPAVE
jgi:tricorn protease